MTINEMIKAMTGHLVALRKAAPHVIDALRRLERLEKAGQNMRNGLKVHTTDEPPHHPWATFKPTVSVLSLGAACVAWDAAVKGDER